MLYNSNMNRVLNIVNSNVCINIMKKAGVEGEFLLWQDFLHEGAVPLGLTLDELSKVRAKFFDNSNFAEYKKVLKDFQERNQKLYRYRIYNNIIIWFEHDLHDQLLLIQILNWFAKQNIESINITMVSTSNYLGESSTKQIQKLLKYRIELLPEHFKLAEKAWSAFCEPTPKEWFKLLTQPTSLLPFLHGAIFRMLEEYPNTKTGLSRTEYQALLIISNGIEKPHDIFEKYQSFEERKFMGDIIFFKILKEFENYNIIESYENRSKLKITKLGRRLLNAEENWLNIKPINRHIGGVHITMDNLWCWDSRKHTIKRYYYSKVLNTFLILK